LVFTGHHGRELATKTNKAQQMMVMVTKKNGAREQAKQISIMVKMDGRNGNYTQDRFSPCTAGVPLSKFHSAGKRR
jgi:hypothetical protein